jgi:hypothetical protein
MRKSSLLPAADEVMSEKSASATFFQCTRTYLKISSAE